MKKESGFIFPFVIVSLLVLFTIGAMLALWFSDTGAKESVKLNNVENNYAVAAAGIKRAELYLKRPDDPGQAHSWSKNYTDTLYVNIDGEQVLISIEDKRIKK
ncbi:MAG: hypothetical protein GF384_03275 [Elusimicrobia bacterium]|nr:hypothetical protein [Elusimicrobiota bacterium]